MTNYPLTWPAGWRRATTRRRAHFEKLSSQTGRKDRLTVAQGVDRVRDELRRLGVDLAKAIISTNVRCSRQTGLPYSDQREPEDPGVAVYWTDAKQEPKVMAIDQYLRVADNLAAVAATLWALRAVERHGGAVILDRVFRGFLALPAPRDWRAIMGLTGTEPLETVRKRYKQLAQTAHPDRGGTDAAMADLNWALEQALQEKEPRP